MNSATNHVPNEADTRATGTAHWIVLSENYDCRKKKKRNMKSFSCTMMLIRAPIRLLSWAATTVAVVGGGF